VLAFLLVAPLTAQQTRQFIFSRSERGFKDASQHLASTAQVLPITLDLRTFRAAAVGDQLRLGAVPLSRGLQVDLDLQEFNVIEPDAVMSITTAQGEMPMPRPTTRLYRGKVAGQDKSYAYLSISDNSVVGSVTTNGKSYQISTDFNVPATASRLEANAYPLADARIEGVCGVNEQNMPWLAPTMSSLEQIEKYMHPLPLGAGDVLYAVKGAFDGDYEYLHNTFAGNKQAAEDYMVQLVGQMSSIYERDLSCQISISYLHLWDVTTGHPYLEAGSMEAALDQANRYWAQNHGDIDRAFAHIFSGKGWQNPIGIAYLDVLCNKLTATCYSLITRTNPEQDIEVVCHETGHIFGSPHTHSCKWNPEIDRCAAAEDGSCFSSSQITQTLGTIMSYCSQKELVFHEKCITLLKNILLQRSCVTLSRRLTVSPLRIYFPNVLINQRRDTTLTAFYQNNSRQPVEVQATALTGSNTGAIFIDSPTPPFTLAPGESKDLKMHYLSPTPDPTIATMKITHDALNPPISVIIEGYAQDKQPILGIVAGGKKEIDFKIHRVGDRVDTTMKNVFANNGEALLRATKSEIVGPDRFEFKLLDGSAPFDLQNGDRLNASFRFAPLTPGPKQAWLRIESNSKNGPDSLSLVGTAKVGPLLRLKLSELSVNFEEREKRKSYDTLISEFFHNAGSDTLQIIADLDGDAKDAFNVNVNAVELAPGESMDLPITLYDTTEGFKKAFLVINQIETEDFTVYRRDTVWLLADITGPSSVPNAAEAVTGFTVTPNPTSADAMIAIAPLRGEEGLTYTLTVADAAGRNVRTYSDRFTHVGTSIALKSDGLPAGTYFLTLRTDKGERMRTLTLTR
jgi:hypothetical protein